MPRELFELVQCAEGVGESGLRLSDESQVLVRAHVQAAEDGRKPAGDRSGLTLDDGPTRPVDEFEVVLGRGGDHGTVSGFGVVAESKKLNDCPIERRALRLRAFRDRSGLLGFRCLAALPFFDPLLDRRVVRRFRCLGNRSANGVEIDIGHDAQDGAFVQQRLAVEARLPEVAGDVVFRIGLPGDALVQAFHEPGQAAQTLSVLREMILDNSHLTFCQRLPLREGAHDRRAPEQSSPATRHFEIVPGHRTFWIDVQDQVVVVGENRIRADIDRKDLGQQRQTVLDFLLAAGIIPSGQGIEATQKLPSHAARNHVIERRHFGRYQSFSRLGHEASGDKNTQTSR